MIRAHTAKQVAEVTARVDKNVNWNTDAFMRGLVDAPSRYMLEGATSVQIIVPENVDFPVAQEMIALFGYSLAMSTPDAMGNPIAVLSWA